MERNRGGSDSTEPAPARTRRKKNPFLLEFRLGKPIVHRFFAKRANRPEESPTQHPIDYFVPREDNAVADDCSVTPNRVAIVPEPSSDQGPSNQWRQAGLALSIPMLMVSGPLVGYFLGYGLVAWLDIGDPWGKVIKVVGLILGVVAGARETIRLIRKISEDDS